LGFRQRVHRTAENAEGAESLRPNSFLVLCDEEFRQGNFSEDDNMRVFSGVMLATVCALAALNTARAEDKKVDKAAAPYVHVVIFTIKKDAPDGTADKVIADCHELLAKIPTVRQIRAGKPADKATDIAKKDYQVGLTVLFDDYDGLKTYIDHKLHQEFLDRNRKYLETPLVYDFVNSEK
jgi:hypothetical protein